MISISISISISITVELWFLWCQAPKKWRKSSNPPSFVGFKHVKTLKLHHLVGGDWNMNGLFSIYGMSSETHWQADIFQDGYNHQPVYLYTYIYIYTYRYIYIYIGPPKKKTWNLKSNIPKIWWWFVLEIRKKTTAVLKPCMTCRSDISTCGVPPVWHVLPDPNGQHDPALRTRLTCPQTSPKSWLLAYQWADPKLSPLISPTPKLLVLR